MVRVACCKCGEVIGDAATGREARDMADLHRMFAHDEMGALR